MTEAKSQKDRALLLSLFMAQDSIKIDQKASRTILLKPRFHSCFISNPAIMIRALYDEKMLNRETLFHTIMTICPTPPKITAETIRTAPASKLPFHSVFFFLQLLHKRSQTYTYTKEAQDYFDSIFNQLQNWISMTNEFDPFLRYFLFLQFESNTLLFKQYLISGLLGKTFILLIRISAVYKAIEVAYKQLSNVRNANFDQLTSDFALKCNSIVTSLEPGSFVKEKSIAIQAKSFVDYCNMNKLILCSYAVDPLVPFDVTIQKMCDEAASESDILNRFRDIDIKMLRHIKRCLMTEWNVVKPVHITNNNQKVEFAHEVFEKMVELELGTIIIEKARNNWDIQCLRKVTPEQIQNQPHIGKTIQELGLKLPEVIKHLSDSDEREPDDSRSKQTKRRQSGDVEPKQSEKRFRINDSNQCYLNSQDKLPPSGASEQRLNDILTKRISNKKNSDLERPYDSMASENIENKMSSDESSDKNVDLNSLADDRNCLDTESIQSTQNADSDQTDFYAQSNSSTHANEYVSQSNHNNKAIPGRASSGKDSVMPKKRGPKGPHKKNTQTQPFRRSARLNSSEDESKHSKTYSNLTLISSKNLNKSNSKTASKINYNMLSEHRHINNQRQQGFSKSAQNRNVNENFDNSMHL